MFIIASCKVLVYYGSTLESEYVMWERLILFFCFVAFLIFVVMEIESFGMVWFWSTSSYNCTLILSKGALWKLSLIALIQCIGISESIVRWFVVVHRTLLCDFGFSCLFFSARFNSTTKVHAVLRCVPVRNVICSF